MSDIEFDVRGAPLKEALHIASLNHVQVTGWSIEKGIPGRGDGQRLILYWADCEEATPLPAPIKSDGIAIFVQAWLDNADYGRSPDTDGDVEKGNRVYNESWGHIGHVYQAFVAIEPYWLVYGK